MLLGSSADICVGGQFVVPTPKMPPLSTNGKETNLLHKVTKRRAAATLNDGESCGVEAIFTILLLALGGCTASLEKSNATRLRQWLTLVLDGLVDFALYMLEDDPSDEYKARVDEIWNNSNSQAWVTHTFEGEAITLKYID